MMIHYSTTFHSFHLKFSIFLSNRGNRRKTIKINDSDEETYTEVDLFDDEEAYIYDNELLLRKMKKENFR
jgi:hypothetical protein